MAENVDTQRFLEVKMPAPARPIITITVTGDVIIADDASEHELRSALKILGESYYEVRRHLPVALFQV